MPSAAAASLYPRLIEDEVYYCGFSSPKSYGAVSYFIRHPAGNWLTDSPRFNDHLVQTFESWGGLRHIFLTHRDDVADAPAYSRRFGAELLIHEADADAARGAKLIKGQAPAELSPDFLAIPVPGHTRGHTVLLYKEKFLFTGDHLFGDPATGTLHAHRDYCWYDWEVQTSSMERLLDFNFEWILPGHGTRLKLPADRMRAELKSLIRRMKNE